MWRRVVWEMFPTSWKNILSEFPIISAMEIIFMALFNFSRTSLYLWKRLKARKQRSSWYSVKEIPPVLPTVSQNTRDISRDIWKFSPCFEMFMYGSSSSSTTKYQPKYPLYFQEYFTIFVVFCSVYVIIQRFLAKPLTMFHENLRFRGTLSGKHCSYVI
jgi:hypothetical protein